MNALSQKLDLKNERKERGRKGAGKGRRPRLRTGEGGKMCQLGCWRETVILHVLDSILS